MPSLGERGYPQMPVAVAKHPPANSRLNISGGGRRFSIGSLLYLGSPRAGLPRELSRFFFGAGFSMLVPTRRRDESRIGQPGWSGGHVPPRIPLGKRRAT